MWQITTGSQNVVATLQEKGLSASNYVLVTFISRATGNKRSAVASVVSSDERKDVLGINIITGNSPSATVHGFNPSQMPAGWYDYEIREQTSPTNTDPEDASIVQVLEYGLAYYTVSEPFDEVTFTQQTSNDVRYVYIQD